MTAFGHSSAVDMTRAVPAWFVVVESLLACQRSYWFASDALRRRRHILKEDNPRG